MKRVERANLHDEAEALVAQLQRHLVHAVLDRNVLEGVLLQEAERVLHRVLVELLRLFSRGQRSTALGEEGQHVVLSLLGLLLLAAQLPQLPQRASQAQLDLLCGVLHGWRWWWSGYR